MREKLTTESDGQCSIRLRESRLVEELLRLYRAEGASRATLNVLRELRHVRRQLPAHRLH